MLQSPFYAAIFLLHFFKDIYLISVETATDTLIKMSFGLEHF